MHIILFASWYPTKRKPLNGNFIRRHAQLLARQHTVSLLHIEKTDNRSEAGVKTHTEGALEETIITLYARPGGFFRLFYETEYYTAMDHFVKDATKRHGKPALMHVHVAWKMAPYALWLSKRTGIPYVITEHWSGFLPEDMQVRGFVMKQLLKWSFAGASAVTAVSRALGKILGEWGAKQPCHITPNQIEMHDLQGAERKEGEPLKLAHLSNFRDSMKNVSGILRAFKNASEAYPEMELNLWGNGFDKDKLRKYCTELGLKDKVHFHNTGTHFEAMQMMCSCHALVTFSHFETFAVTVAEAVCHGVPAIYAPCGGPEEYMRPHPHWGIEVPNGNEAELTRALLSLAKNEIAFDRIRIRSEAREYFSDRKLLDSFSQAYAEALGSKSEEL